jgi:leucyl-tRNA synthetase
MTAVKKKTNTKKKTTTKKVVKATKAKAVKKPVASKAQGAKRTVKKAAVTKAIMPAPSGAIVPVSEKPKAVVPVEGKPRAIQAAPKAEKPKKDISYNPQVIEGKWQRKWEADKLYRSVIDESKPKHYALTMLPYPSGNLHIGHWYAMTPSDARARWMRMRGYNVLFPMGFDAFGLPAENAAIRDGVHPMKRTYENIAYMRQQLRSMGAIFDWEREAVSSDTEYYKWTQWFFNQLFKHGLAYKKMAAVDWCPNCNTTLAREQVIGEERVCERCGTPVIKKDLEQWFFKTTKYADELINFDGIDWPEKVRTMQTNWVGRSEGAEVRFPVIGTPPSGTSGTSQSSEPDGSVTVFTTRPDTLWGATFMVFSPEHPLVDEITSPEQKTVVEEYKAQAARQTDVEREAADKEKTGVFSGGYAINQVNGERIPIWIADYVLMGYGTGAIMGVPAHDERDFAFAKRYDLPIVEVIRPVGQDSILPYVGDGIMVNSGPFNGTKVNNEKGRKNPGIGAVIDWLEEKGIGKEAVNYRLRDWLISRQRYWGAPIPIVYCPEHGQVPVPDDQLPVTLPEDVEWLPTGQSPLKLHPTWRKTTCPICGREAERDTDTMDTFMCSSWYHLRYLSPHYDKGPFDPKEYDYWMPVDTYTGGAEHATMHLIYTRFFHKALRDMGIVEGHEPMMQLRNQGQILGPDGQRMSKSRGNVIDPDEQVRKYGADAARCYLMFGYRWSEGGPWNTENIQGVVRWLNRVWVMFTEEAKPGKNAEASKTLRRRTHQSLKRLSRDFEQFEFNTVISTLMELMNEMYKAREAGAGGTPEWDEARDYYLRMLAPVAPHIAEELWTNHLGKPYSIHNQPWPRVDEEAAKEEVIELPVQINGKVRDRITVPADSDEETIKSAALASEIVKKYLDGREPKKIIVAKGRLVSLVV